MKFFFLFLFLAFSSLCHAQWSIKFCEEVTPDGVCIYENTVVFLNDSSNTFSFLVCADGKITFNTNKLHYSIYKIGTDNIPVYQFTIHQNISGTWTYIMHDLNIDKAGLYEIRVEGEDKKLLCTGRVKILI